MLFRSFDNQFTEEGDVLDSLNWDCINPATGPVYVEGAMPGDVLKVKIEDIRVASWGTMAAIPENGVLGDCCLLYTSRCVSETGWRKGKSCLKAAI